jgi:hypothetical protein
MLERLTVLDDRKNVGGPTQEDLEEGFVNQVVDVARRLRSVGHLESNSNLDSDQRKYLRRLFDRQLSKYEWKAALAKLTEIIFTITERTTIVLVDEYDTPMSEALQRGYLEEVTTFSPRFKINSHTYPGQFLFQEHIQAPP